MTDQDDKYESHEESEYQYSDDYTAEAHKEAPHSADEAHAPVVAPAPKKNMKRMVVFGILFVGLVGIAYKIVVPSSTVPSTTITAAQVTEPTAPVAPTSVASTTTSPAMTPPTAPVATAQPITGLPPSGAMVQASQAASPPPASPTPPPISTQAIAAAPTAMPTAGESSPAMMTQQSMPAVIPVQMPDTTQTTVPSTIVTTSQTSSTTNAQIANMAGDSERLMNQLQVEYVQKINDFNTQNKQLQTQVQELNSRIGSLETELSQLVRALDKQGVGGSSSNPATQQAPRAADPKITFNVQAIIPGRAWLKADNGETVTVAEGDVIRNLGKISKIDPYDGVVEINTGSKIVALSYGNGS